ncbi:hypothetical protein X798_06212 [Onchocerca flexuosa]|uniref:Uncharacterized protein n=1 Tax=Onchocerca flexuosa TaxID=387005 RepID=A0A238BMX6_9BILA|nr:hypothetical protein X798_06212 [Onchocerca flexuosa]
MLTVPSVWQDAATQQVMKHKAFTFYRNLCNAILGFIMQAKCTEMDTCDEFIIKSFNDALITSTINCATSFLSGFVIFSTCYK